MHNTRKERIFLCALFFFALALRIGYLIFLKHNYLFFEHPSDDVAYYQSWAKTIAAGDWLGTNAFSGMPLFPYYLALVFRICLGSWFAANIFNLILVVELPFDLFFSQEVAFNTRRRPGKSFGRNKFCPDLL